MFYNVEIVTEFEYVLIYKYALLVLKWLLMSTNGDFCRDPSSVREQIAELCRANINFASTAV